MAARKACALYIRAARPTFMYRKKKFFFSCEGFLLLHLSWTCSEILKRKKLWIFQNLKVFMSNVLPLESAPKMTRALYINELCYYCCWYSRNVKPTLGGVRRFLIYLRDLMVLVGTTPLTGRTNLKFTTSSHSVSRDTTVKSIFTRRSCSIFYKTYWKEEGKKKFKKNQTIL